MRLLSGAANAQQPNFELFPGFGQSLQNGTSDFRADVLSYKSGKLWSCNATYKNLGPNNPVTLSCKSTYTFSLLTGSNVKTQSNFGVQQGGQSLYGLLVAYWQIDQDSGVVVVCITLGSEPCYN
jgi:hypothetical protein